MPTPCKSLVKVKMLIKMVTEQAITCRAYSLKPYYPPRERSTSENQVSGVKFVWGKCQSSLVRIWGESGYIGEHQYTTSLYILLSSYVLQLQYRQYLRQLYDFPKSLLSDQILLKSISYAQIFVFRLILSRILGHGAGFAPMLDRNKKETSQSNSS